MQNTIYTPAAIRRLRNLAVDQVSRDLLKTLIEIIANRQFPFDQTIPVILIEHGCAWATATFDPVFDELTVFGVGLGSEIELDR